MYGVTSLQFSQQDSLIVYRDSIMSLLWADQ